MKAKKRVKEKKEVDLSQVIKSILAQVTSLKPEDQNKVMGCIIDGVIEKRHNAVCNAKNHYKSLSDSFDQLGKITSI